MSIPSGAAPAVGAAPPLVMPAALERVLTAVLESEGPGPSPPPPPPPPVPTAVLLRRVDELYAAYTRVVALACRSLEPHTSNTHTSDSTPTTTPTTAAAQLEAEMAEAAAAYERCAAELQAGIRSKVQQTCRIAVIEHLRAEVQQRQAAVDKMESTLEVARRHL